MISSKIPYGRQNITQEDIDVLIEALQSDFLTQGPTISEFESRFANYVDAKYAIAVTNGTAALHLSALALSVKPGDKVITSSLTFAASANCIKYCGGDVHFIDIDPNTYLIDLDKVENLLKSVPKGTYTGIIPVDFAGRPVNLERCKKLAVEYGLWIIEDACHAPGASFVDSNGTAQKSGNGSFADLAIFSFHPVKHIATGEGGMITTNDKKLYKKLLTLRTHGITREPLNFKNSILEAGGNVNDTIYPGWYMEMQDLGYNYRITDFQCALGISQLQRADDGLKKRLAIAKKYDLAFQNKQNVKSTALEIDTKFTDKHAYHLYILLVEDRLGLYNHLKANGIFAQIHYYPVHLMPYYRNLGWKENDLPFVETYYQKCISLPMYPTLTNDEQEYVINTVLNYYKES
jgi:UDP-4-amino-4,6-dideoxy-N-acetyl-beta-L-altrosamine transaminase